MARHGCVTGLALLGFLFSGAAAAGPPYAADDPVPTDYRHYEIYLFATGETGSGGKSGAGGVDFNYGATPELQLTAVFPVAYDHAGGERALTGLGNVELAAKYRFLHGRGEDWSIAVFPRVFLRSASSGVGEQHAAYLLPLWLQKDWDDWSTFGGGGCVINHGGVSKNYCLAAWALTRQVLPRVRIGAEIQHQTPDTRDGRSSTGIGAGLQYDLSDYCHLLAYTAPGIQNAAETARYAWYASLLLTF